MHVRSQPGKSVTTTKGGGPQNADGDVHPSGTAARLEEVLANDAEDGVMSPGVERFERDADERLEELRESLIGGATSRGISSRCASPRPAVSAS